MPIHTYAIRYQPYHKVGCYELENILTISSVPQGPLKSIVTRLSPPIPPVSAFQSIKDEYQKCVLAFQHSPQDSSLLTLNDLPKLIDFCTTHHYQLDNALTNTLNNNMQKLVIFISYDDQH